MGIVGGVKVVKISMHRTMFNKLSYSLFRMVSGVLVMGATGMHSFAADQGYLIPADRGEGFYFAHHDWEIACDNTRTCRAAGYHSDDSSDMRVSVLLTRNAGPGTPVKGELMLGQYGDDDPDLSALPEKLTLVLRINGKKTGSLSMKKTSLVADLPSQLTAALLGALVKKSTIELTHGDMRWQLSDAGATAVLLKMDEFQGRIGTPSALVKKGTKSEASVRAAVPAPVLTTPLPPKPQEGDATFVARNGVALVQVLQAATNQDDCGDLFDVEKGEPQLESVRMSDTQVLVSTRCWLAAYNFGYGHWLVNNQSPFSATLVTTMADDGTANGSLSASHKGRGLGDCWSSDEWSWDGRQFVHTQSSSTGQCKLMAPGGAWQLPTIVTDVRLQR